MLGDVATKEVPLNPCCSLWKEKYSKIVEGRACLRRAVKILEEQVDKIQAENVRLKSASEEEQVRAETEKEAKEKESVLRVSLENEISALKAELSSFRERGTADAESHKREAELLQVRVSAGEKEVSQLKVLLENEKKRADAEKKNAQKEKKSTAEAWKLLKAEKDKGDEERKLAYAEGKKAEEYRLQVEALQKELAMKVSLVNEVSSLKSKLSSLQQKECVDTEDSAGELKLLQGRLSSAEKEINRLKELHDHEKKRADAEKKNAAKAWKLVEAEKTKADEERKHASTEGKKAEEYRLKFEALQKETAVKVSLENEASSLKSKLSSSQLKACADTEDKAELKFLQCRISGAEKEINRLKQLLASEKKKADAEKKNAEAERKNAVKAWKLLEAEKTKVAEERKHADVKGKKAEEYQLQLDALKKEANVSKSKLVSMTLKFEDAMKKLEVEKQNKGRKYTDMQRDKLANQRKQAEANGAKVRDEKSYGENLFLHLEDARKMKLFPSRTTTEASALRDRRKKAEITKVKLLKKELKLQKLQLKNAKQLVKLEKSQNSILLQELNRLKMDCFQILCRLDVLDRCFSPNTQGTESLEKAGNFASMQISKLKRNIGGLEPFQTFHWDASESHPSHLAMANSDIIRQALHCNAPLPSRCGGNCAEFISGIDSKLESLLGGSNQKLFQSSAMNSSSASFSDGQLVGSQGRGAFVTRPDKLKEENSNALPTVSSISAEVTKVDHSENVAAAAENNDVRFPHSNDIVGKVNGHTKKRRMLDTMQSVEFLYSEGKRLHLQMEEKLSALHSMLNREIDKQLDLEEPNFVEANMQGGSYTKHQRFHRKRKLSHDENVVPHNLSGINERSMTTKVGNEVILDASVGKQPTTPVNNQMENLHVGSECLSNPFGSDIEQMASFESVTNVDFMKLLELDDAADEEYYRRATEVPMSPDLPEIRFSARDEIFDVDQFEPLMNANSNKEVSNEEEVMRPSLTFNVLQHQYSPAYCVIFSNINDSGSISRVLGATRTCMAHCSLDTRKESLVQNILHALKLEEKLVPKEKACTFFTMLLLNFSICTSGKFEGISDGDFSTWLSSFAGQIHAAISGVEESSLFVEACFLDELLDIIEDFLINGRVMCSNGSSGPLSESDTVINILQDGVNVFSRSASTEQLLTGSIILASLCAVIDHIGFICEASFNLLRMHKWDSSVVIAMLHIFASLCGEKFLFLKEYSLTMTVLKSVVVFHEGENSVLALASCISSVDKSRIEFHPCGECPFSQDAVSVDNIASMLLDILKSCALLGTNHQSLMNLANLSNSNVPSHKDKVEHVSCQEEHFAVEMNYNASCGLNEFLMPVAQSNSLSNGTAHDLTDVLSLVELLACNVGWEWTCDKIIPELLAMLERPILDNFFVAFVILLGQLGRLGVATKGYEDKGVQNLRYNLSGFLWRDTTIRAVLPVQLATVTALLGLLAVDFEKVVHGDLDLPEIEIASQYVFANSIRKWFSSLSKEQQALSFSLLQFAK